MPPEFITAPHPPNGDGIGTHKLQSGVMITHVPTGLVVACNSSRNMAANRDLAMAEMRHLIAQAEKGR